MAFNESSSLALGGREHSDSYAPIIDPSNDEEEEEEFFTSSRKQKSKAAEQLGDGQKHSAFRRKKGKDGGNPEGKARKSKSMRVKSTPKTPPESPRARGEGSGRSKGGKGGTSSTQTTPQGKSGKKTYESLLDDNDFSSDEVGEEEVENSFVLSRGHIAREKRSSVKSMQANELFSVNTGGEGGGGMVAQNPLVFDMPSPSKDKSAFISNPSAGADLPAAQSFPVNFSPPTEARFPDTIPDTSLFPPLNFNSSAQSANTTGAIFIAPPPPTSSASITPANIPSIPPPPSTLPITALSQPPLQFPPVASPTSPPSEPPDLTNISPPNWTMTEEFQQKCSNQFSGLQPEGGLLQGEKARGFFVQSKLPREDLSKIWKLVDSDQDGAISLDEFCIAMKLVLLRRQGHAIPATLPQATVLRKKTGPRPNSAKLTFSIPPPPAAPPTSAVSQSLKHTQSSGQLPQDMSSLQSFTEQKRPLSSSGIEKLTSSEQHKSRRAGEDERALMSESFSSDLPGEEPQDFVRSESLGFGFEVSLREKLPSPPLVGEEPALARLISFSDNQPSVETADDTSVLVSRQRFGKMSVDRRRSSSLSDDQPVPKPRKKRQSPKVDKSSSSTSTETTPVRTAAPPRPPPYKNRTELSTSPPTRSSSMDSFQAQYTEDKTPFISVTESSPQLMKAKQVKPVRPPRGTSSHYTKHEDGNFSDEDVTDGWLVKSGSDSKKKGLVQTSSSEGTSEEHFTKGHTRTTSWDLNKMLREEQISIHKDMPSAEPPKLPPRTKQNFSFHAIEEVSPSPVLSRSASTGSLASVGRGLAPPGRSRSPSVESGSILSALELSQSEHLIPKRKAPSPPPSSAPTVKPRPKKKPMYPPSFKRVGPEEGSELVESGSYSSEERSQLVASYRKKSKYELQKSIQSLKDDNATYTKMNKDLRTKLMELKEEETRIRIQLEQLNA